MMEDNEILALYFTRSEQAIAETDQKFGGYCYSIAYNILTSREDSEECVSDTYLAAWNAIPLRRPGLLAAFLGKLTRHISIDRWRKAHAPKAGRRGNGSGTGGIAGLHRQGGRRNRPGRKGADPAAQCLSRHTAGDGTKRISVPVLVPGLHSDHFGAGRLYP